MMIRGLNHITLSVSNLESSLSFYTENLGFRGHVKWDTGAYLSVGELWLCLSLDKAVPTGDYTHIAFDVDEADFLEVKNRLIEAEVEIWKDNKSEGKSMYILDPDGHKLEIHVGNLQSRLDSLREEPYKGLVWL